MMVADDLHLDMARLADQPLDIDAVVAEGRLGLGLAARIGLLQLGGVARRSRMPRPPPPAIALIMTAPPAPSEAKNSFASSSVVGPPVPSMIGHAAAFRQRLGRDLVAEQIERLGRRADEDDALLGAAPRQRGILAEKAVAGMQRVAAGRLGGRDDRLDIEIGPRAASRDFTSFVGGADMQRQRVVRRDRSRRWRCRFRRPRGDANGDLAAIGDQQFVKGHEYFRLRTQRSFMVGSSTIRKDSPSALNASAMTRIASPGAYICSGAISIY